tara:strand:+ start:209 stop:394 length:186 start_codon:yes stop_codon:yes gene_type:complete
MEIPVTSSLCAMAFSRANCHSTSVFEVVDSPRHPKAFISSHTSEGHVGHPMFRECFGTIEV